MGPVPNENPFPCRVLVACLHPCPSNTRVQATLGVGSVSRVLWDVTWCHVVFCGGVSWCVVLRRVFQYKNYKYFFPVTFPFFQQKILQEEFFVGRPNLWDSSEIGKGPLLKRLRNVVDCGVLRRAEAVIEAGNDKCTLHAMMCPLGPFTYAFRS